MGDNTSGTDTLWVVPPTDYEHLVEDVRTEVGDDVPNDRGDDT